MNILIILLNFFNYIFNMIIIYVILYNFFIVDINFLSVDIFLSIDIFFSSLTVIKTFLFIHSFSIDLVILI